MGKLFAFIHVEGPAEEVLEKPLRHRHQRLRTKEIKPMPSDREWVRERLRLVEQWLEKPDREFEYEGQGRGRRRMIGSSLCSTT